jgi:myo-inositol-1(or 4)-monophosphatase
VADGTIDAFIDLRGRLRTTDAAAAWLIIKEAGAKISTPNGKPLNAKLDPKERLKFIAAANPKIYGAILGLIEEKVKRKRE